MRYNSLEYSYLIQNKYSAKQERPVNCNISIALHHSLDMRDRMTPPASGFQPRGLYCTVYIGTLLPFMEKQIENQIENELGIVDLWGSLLLGRSQGGLVSRVMATDNWGFIT